MTWRRWLCPTSATGTCRGGGSLQTAGLRELCACVLPLSSRNKCTAWPHAARLCGSPAVSFTVSCCCARSTWRRCSEGASDTFKGTPIHRVLREQAIFGGKSNKCGSGKGLGRGRQGMHGWRCMAGRWCGGGGARPNARGPYQRACDVCCARGALHVFHCWEHWYCAGTTAACT